MKFYIARRENADFRTRSLRKTAFYTRSDENKCSKSCFYNIGSYDDESPEQ